ncbi:DUF4097 family beta strand repeat-containing protein [Streptomyces malaysiensis]|uniref:DUF4097 family beta strand repeat-containing protein n=1 Tax=Streptomyces malaysiensis TaxID=92644 RepID=UPI002B2B9737|nr:DUF4097 family beta strand repeat-containing protein [Streptomyces malaysiensis]
MRRIVRISAILTGVTLVGGAAWYLLLFLVTATESATTAISPSVRNVELSIDSGDVEVDVVGQGEKPELHKKLTKSLRSPDETIKQEAGTLHVTTRCGEGVGKCASDYHLTVPVGTRIKVETRLGDVSVQGVRASVEGRTRMGGVRLEHITGDQLVAASKTGAITLKDVTFHTGEATTKLGDVRVENIEAFEKLTAVSKTGDIELHLPEDAGPFAVNAETKIGDRKVTVDQDSSDGAIVNARTKIGDVTVRAD